MVDFCYIPPLVVTFSLLRATEECMKQDRDRDTGRNELPFPQDTSQRLLESLGAQFQRVVINALAGQTLYATVTITQGAQTREVDLRLSEALALAVRMGTCSIHRIADREEGSRAAWSAREQSPRVYRSPASQASTHSRRSSAARRTIRIFSSSPA